MGCNNDCLNCIISECIHDHNKENNYEKTGKVGRPGKYPDGFSWSRYYEDNKEEIRARNRKRYREKREQILEYGHRYYSEHSELWKPGGKYYEKRKEAHVVLQRDGGLS